MEYFPNYNMFQYSDFGQFHPNFAALQYQDRAEVWRRHAMAHHAQRPAETKPRLAKEEVDKLEREFQRNPKPNSSLKKQLAEDMRVDIARINNWFQNRRAKAKQEKRTQESEARRNSEQSTDKTTNKDSVKEYYPDDDHHDDLRPSAAPFPTADKTDVSQGSTSQQLDSVPEVFESDHTSPSSAAFPSHDQTCSEFGSFASGSPHDFASMVSNDADQHQIPEHQLTLAIPTGFRTGMPDVTSADSLTQFSDMSSSASMNGMAAFSTSFFNTDSAGLGGLDSDRDSFKFNHLSPDSAQSPMSTGSAATHFKSPPIDIAGRRKTKRPAQLGTSCMRSASYNHGGIKTGLDMKSRRMDMSPMRRVASATGTLPRGIHKTGGTTPRSPMYFDRAQETMLFQMASRTPVVQAPSSSAAPPTPDTPALLNQQIKEAAAEPAIAEEDKRFPFSAGLAMNQFSMDPTMKTPPDTPGMMNTMSGAAFGGNHLAPNFEYAFPDEPLITPGLGSFETDFGSMPTNLPSYVSPSGTSQPSTPSYPTSSLGPTGFFPFGGSNVEYNWSDAAAAELGMSPGQLSRARQFQFANMTQRDFHE